jgi:predicted NBD/HSP70 family sugar kinase
VRAAPAAAELLRRHNTALVLRALREQGPASRAELAGRTGLAKATVGTIVAGLEANGAVRAHDADSAPAGRGRPGRPVALDGRHTVGLGVEVNVDYLAAVALDLAGRTVLFEERAVPPSAGDQEPDVLAALLELAGDCHRNLVADGRDVLGLAVAVPGLVDGELGRVRSAPNLGWTDLDLAGRLAAVVGDGCPVRIDNDANCAARAEVERGAAAGVRDVVYLTGTVGLGAGIVVDGSTVRGGHGFAGEVGHVRVGGSEAPCACGRHGCWEAQVGLRAILAAVGMEDEAGGDPVDAARAVADRAATDPGVRAGLADVADRLAAGVGLLVNVLDPDMVVLGGSFVPLGPWLLPVVEETLADAVLSAPATTGDARHGCRIELSRLGLQAAATGAAAEVVGEVYAGRIGLPAA